MSSEKKSNNHNDHVTSYFQNAVVLVVLLLLTSITILVASLNLGKLEMTVALAVASIKATIVAWYFMHLKHEPPYIRYAVLAVFVLIALIIIFTFFDYSFR
jgi:cytochrome c oxidase subunit 4